MTTSHVWRLAFSRFFPGQSLQNERQANHLNSNQNPREIIYSDTCLFTRLTDLASWRSEYILRTRLLQCLSRGRPVKTEINHTNPPRTKSTARSANPVITYGSGLSGSVNHIHAVFDSAKKTPRFIHGSNDTCTATISDPVCRKLSRWELLGSRDLPPLNEAWPGHLPYGLYDGPTIVPNSMDVSQKFGGVIGEGLPGGRIYYQSSNEMRGRYLHQNVDLVDYGTGIPRVPANIDGVSAVWIAKSQNIPRMTQGLIGILCGSTLGVVTAYSFGSDSANIKLVPQGSVTAKWVLSPGVPIIAFDVDDSYNSKRKDCGRVWAVALNALGEVFYLNQSLSASLAKTSDEIEAERQAWNTGSTVYWHMIKDTRRIAYDNPYQCPEVHGSYFPRSSPKSLNLSQAQMWAETREIEAFFQYTPAHFRKKYDTWDMRRKLHVDFGGDDGNGAGEAVFIIKLGVSEGQPAEILRRTRFVGEMTTKNFTKYFESQTCLGTLPDSSLKGLKYLSFNLNYGQHSNQIPSDINSSREASSYQKFEIDPDFVSEKWLSTNYSLENYPGVELTCSAIDMSTYALFTIGEDPINSAKSPSHFTASNERAKGLADESSTIPGHRARFLATGTKTGSVIIWNMRGPLSSNQFTSNKIYPLRVIHTASLQISCIAVSALYVVHGGNDGLVQAWDPLGSSSQPIRTLNSRATSTHARRVLEQNDTSMIGVRTEPHAASAIILDPNPTILRGIVSVGMQLRYWAFSSSKAEEYPRKKRRQRPFGQGNNSSPERFFSSGRGDINSYIAEEQAGFSKQLMQRSQESAHLLSRFGVGLYGLTEEETTLYAELISIEDYTKVKGTLNIADFHSKSDNGNPESVSTHDAEIADSQNLENAVDDFERDLSEAIRLSLLET